MATKKTPTKKTATKKPVKRPAAKKAPAKASGVVLTPDNGAFMTFRLTRQTVYWLVLGTVVVLFSIWILRLQSDIQSIYDKIEATQADTESTYVQPVDDKKKN